MKKFRTIAKMLCILALVVGLAFIACKNDPLNGTWKWTYSTFEYVYVFNNGSFTTRVNGSDTIRGTYTKTDSEITMTITEGYFDAEMAALYNTTVGWKNRSQLTEILRGMGMSEGDINEWLADRKMPYTLDGNTLTLDDLDYTRQ